MSCASLQHQPLYLDFDHTFCSLHEVHKLAADQLMLKQLGNR